MSALSSRVRSAADGRKLGIASIFGDMGRAADRFGANSPRIGFELPAPSARVLNPADVGLRSPSQSCGSIPPGVAVDSWSSVFWSMFCGSVAAPFPRMLTSEAAL